MKTKKEKLAGLKIKDLPENASLGGVKFHDPTTGTTGYWFSQWGYPNGKAGVWWKPDMNSGAIFPLFLDNLEQTLEWDVLEETKC